MPLKCERDLESEREEEEVVEMMMEHVIKK
jgi:hypothetical protein